MKCALIKEKLEKLSLFFDCKEEDNKLIIKTPIEYPDGDYIDLYLIEENNNLVLTDFAEALTNLASYNFDIKRSPKRFKFFEDILMSQNIHYFKNSLRINIKDINEIATAIFRLTQAILRISDLMFMAKYGAGSAFKEEVEELFIDNNLRYESNYKISGRSGQSYMVDFYIEQMKPSLLQTLSTGSSAYAENLINKTVRMFYDLKKIDGKFNYYSLIDDTTDIWKPSHFEILSDLSDVFTWGERDKFLDALSHQ